ncbi:MAG: RusA family crossover junction endodeoxyribonuclease [Euryarchaeota archaeon]|nr:RusA family crossover junction endodeoxyribonuclease [Euryarchaeota archaeon]
MSKYTAKANTNECLTLEDSEGSFGDLITVKTKNKTKKEMIDEIRSSQGSWMEKFPDLHDTDKKIDMAIVVYRRVGYLKRQDLDNIAKVVLDALKGYLFGDDSQIVRLLLVKKEAELLAGYDTDSLVISFRIHDPERDMILINEKNNGTW